MANEFNCFSYGPYGLLNQRKLGLVSVKVSGIGLVGD